MVSRQQVEVPKDNAVLADVARGRGDIEFFALRFLGIRGNPGQVPWWNACVERDGEYRPRYLTTVVSAGNRAGKTLAMAILIFHHAFYKIGIRPPRDTKDTYRWLDTPYEWYHIAVQQETAERTHIELTNILQGVHVAQEGRGCPLIQLFGPIADTQTKERSEYLRIKLDQLVGGSCIYFRSAQEKARALLGKDMNGISYDEASAELYLMHVYQEVLNLRRLSTGGPLHFIGTPITGSIEYQDLWEMGNPENPLRDPKVRSFRFPTWLNIGFGLSQNDYDDIKRQILPHLIPQNLGGEFIEATDAYFGSQSVEAMFDTEMTEETPPIKGHRYVQGVDPGIAADATWGIMLDHTNVRAIRGVRVKRSIGRQTIPAIVSMVRESHLLYSSDGASCMTVVDSTGLGGKMFEQEFAVIKPVRDFDFAGSKSKKLELLADLKVVIERGELKVPRNGRFWNELRRQMLTYKLDDRKITQDAVMALAIAVRHAIRNPGLPAETPVFSFF